jgi:hypothetical protein
VLIVALLLGFVSKEAFAQSLPPATSDDQMGLQPYQAYHGGDIDSISLSTGTLNLNFPFLSYPQRGKLHLSFNLYYNNQWQHQGEYCITVQNRNECIWMWGHTLVQSPLPIARSNVFIDSAQHMQVTGTNPILIEKTSFYRDCALALTGPAIR